MTDNRTSLKKLTPCPYCGSCDHSFVSYTEIYYVECDSCGGKSPPSTEPLQAITLHNTRFTKRKEL